MLFDARGGSFWFQLAITVILALSTVAFAAEPRAIEVEEAAPTEAEEPTPAMPPPETDDGDSAQPDTEPANDDLGEAEPDDPATPVDRDESTGDPEMQPDADLESQASDAPATLPEDTDREKPAPIEPESTPADEPKRGAIDAASLKGVSPGRTTHDELHSRWGQPKQVDAFDGGVRETFEVKPFDKVQATIVDEVVDSLAIHLANPVDVRSAARQLQVDDVEPVEVFDDAGRLAGLAYPERGVLFGFAEQSNPPRVAQVVLEPIDAQPFLDRARKRLDTRFTDCLADLKRALEVSSDATAAHWLHAELTLRAGDLEQALDSAQKIVDGAPEEPEYRLTLAKVLAARGDYAKAIEQASAVAELDQAPGVVVARAHCQWGDSLAAAQKHDYKLAIEHHLKAIAMAEPLAKSRNFSERSAAKQVLIDAHLAVAYDIGWGRWQQKSTIVPKWIDRAALIVEDVVTKEHGSLDVRLRLYERALAALAGIHQPPDAARWIRGTTELGKKMFDKSSDPAYKAHLAWRLGTALNDAVEIEATRQRLEQALALGKIALDYFEKGEAAGKQLPARDFLCGRLCYRMGAILAVQRSDHRGAIPWFDRAVPLLENPVPASVVDCGKQGETFVSMAVSYWEVDDRDEALRLTNQGVKLMERAVSEGLLEETALAIPYGNLASMHEALGDAQEAQKFSELAARHVQAVTK